MRTVYFVKCLSGSLHFRLLAQFELEIKKLRVDLHQIHPKLMPILGGTAFNFESNKNSLLSKLKHADPGL